MKLPTAICQCEKNLPIRLTDNFENLNLSLVRIWCLGSDHMALNLNLIT